MALPRQAAASPGRGMCRCAGVLKVPLLEVREWAAVWVEMEVEEHLARTRLS